MQKKYIKTTKKCQLLQLVLLKCCNCYCIDIIIIHMYIIGPVYGATKIRILVHKCWYLMNFIPFHSSGLLLDNVRTCKRYRAYHNTAKCGCCDQSQHLAASFYTERLHWEKSFGFSMQPPWNNYSNTVL